MLAFGFGFWEDWELNDKVTFNMFTRTISVNPGVTSIDVKADIYSASKRWLIVDDNNKIGQIVRVIGGDATVAGQKAGDIYFLINGWRLQVNLSTTAVIGSIFSDDFDSPLISFSGDQVLQSLVSSLVTGVDSSGTAFDVWAYSARTLTASPLSAEQDLNLSDIHGQTSRSVYVDTELDVNGNGYQQSPYNNWTSAVDYAEANGLKKLITLADAVIDRQLKNFEVRGVGVPSIDLNGHIMDGSIFERCKLTGSYTGTIQATECAVVNLSGMQGVFLTISAAGTLTPLPGGSLLISRVAPALATQAWTLNMNSGVASTVAVHNSSGEIIVTNMDHAGDTFHLHATNGELIIDPSCTDGNIVVSGTIRVVDNSAGATVNISAVSSEITLDAIA